MHCFHNRKSGKSRAIWVKDFWKIFHSSLGNFRPKSFTYCTQSFEDMPRILSRKRVNMGRSDLKEQSTLHFGELLSTSLNQGKNIKYHYKYTQRYKSGDWSFSNLCMEHFLSRVCWPLWTLTALSYCWY